MNKHKGNYDYMFKIKLIGTSEDSKSILDIFSAGLNDLSDMAIDFI